jgi:hypothetical protein
LKRTSPPETAPNENMSSKFKLQILGFSLLLMLFGLWAILRTAPDPKPDAVQLTSRVLGVLLIAAVLFGFQLIKTRASGGLVERSKFQAMAGVLKAIFGVLFVLGFVLVVVKNESLDLAGSLGQFLVLVIGASMLTSAYRVFRRS